MILSIIIPCYNAAGTIHRCLDSILQADSFALVKEVICINDGSTDGTWDTLSVYGKEFDIIKLIDKKNEGVSIARNIGLEHASGEYLWLIDSDDFISPRSFSVLEQHLNTDIINFGYRQEDSSGEYQSNLVNVKSSENESTGYQFLDRNDGRLYLWNNVYKRSFLQEHSIKFLAKLISLEDSLFNTVAFAKAKRVKILSNELYTYCYNQSSISRIKSLDHLLKLGQSSINVHTNILSFRNERVKSSHEYNIIQKRLMHTVLGFFYSLLVEKYPIYYVKEILITYGRLGLVPVKRENNDFKILVFQRMVNMQWPFLLLCRLNRIT
ncbi:glycosyltransferase [Bacteroidia bacterium]|nr:glycosyltransferase [Bacteroidia bacterium]